MVSPSPETVAAALRLAEAIAADGFFTHSGAVDVAIEAYRATLPKLRTRAEVDAEIAKLTRECVDNEWAGDDDIDRWDAVTRLCREPTAEPEAKPKQQRPLFTPKTVPCSLHFKTSCPECYGGRKAP